MAIDLRVTHKKQRRVLNLLMRLYGDDTDAVLNALHEMTARIAIAGGVSPEDYAAGMKYHWDNLVNTINDHAEHLHH